MTGITIDDVTKRFGEGDGSIVAVDDISLDIRDGEFVVFVGPSGSGKSTLMRIVADSKPGRRATSTSATSWSTSTVRARGTSRWCSRTTRCTRT